MHPDLEMQLNEKRIRISLHVHECLHGSSHRAGDATFSNSNRDLNNMATLSVRHD